MRTTKILSFIFGVSILLTSCYSGNSVVSNNLISKRKYTKGFHVNSKQKLKSTDEKSIDSEDVAKADVKTDKVDRKVEREERRAEKQIAKQEVATQNELAEVYEIVETEDVNTYALNTSTSDELLDEEQVEENYETVVSDNNESVESVESISATSSGSSQTGAMLVLLVILALILPPVAVLIYEGVSTWFWVTLILTIIAFGGWFLIGGLGGIAGLAAVIIALLVIFEVI